LQAVERHRLSTVENFLLPNKTRMLVASIAIVAISQRFRSAGPGEQVGPAFSEFELSATARN
jgi:hypothetical protein